MRYLLYCIFPSQTDFRRGTIVGVGGQPVSVIVTNGLGAALSSIADFNPTLEIPQIRTYQQVIESFHRHCTVIPMRYGCLFEEKSQIVRLLEERGGHYATLLTELEGCVEMGIRVLIPNSETPTSHSPLRISLFTPRNPDLLGSGGAYLAARKTHYADREQLTGESIAVVHRCRATFAGLFVRYKLECPPFRPLPSAFRIPLFSLYFLVPRSSMETFREAFRQLSAKESAKLLMSGPWPPYNFVQPDQNDAQGLINCSVKS